MMKNHKLWKIKVRKIGHTDGQDNDDDIHAYTCFAPALIFKSCLIKRTMYFRSFDVHLEWKKNILR
jgi:hypothetical protein